MSEKTKPKKKFFKRKPVGQAAASEDGANESTSYGDDSILQYESGDPTAIKRWQDHWGLRADTLFPGLSSIFILDQLPDIDEVVAPSTVWDDINVFFFFEYTLINYKTCHCFDTITLSSTTV